MPLLASAALHLARLRGRQRAISGYQRTVVELDNIEQSVSILGRYTQVEVWDQTTQRTIKVLTARWDSWNAAADERLLAVIHETLNVPNEVDIEVMSFRRGAWEEMLIAAAQRALSDDGG